MYHNVCMYVCMCHGSKSRNLAILLFREFIDLLAMLGNEYSRHITIVKYNNLRRPAIECCVTHNSSMKTEEKLAISLPRNNSSLGLSRHIIEITRQLNRRIVVVRYSVTIPKKIWFDCFKLNDA